MRVYHSIFCISSRRRHTRYWRDWSSDVCSSDLHPYLAHVWAKKGADLRVPTPGQSAKVAMLGVLDWARRKLIVRTSRTKRSSDFIALLRSEERRVGKECRSRRSPYH